MSYAERQYNKSVDDLILKASGEDLKRLQELDMKTQLQTNSFYDAYSTRNTKPKKHNIASTPHKKNKLK